MILNVGTRSVLFGVHCFFIHPFVLAIAWWKLFGFPWDPRLWACFFLHDVGYLGKPNMDGPEGEQHPYLGARIAGWLFGQEWYWFSLLHSRYLAKKLVRQPSKLALADKLVIAIEPSWLYLPRAIASGEIEDYRLQALKANPAKESGDAADALRQIKQGGMMRDWRLWHRGLRRYMAIWVERHKDGQVDLMTSSSRGN